MSLADRHLFRWMGVGFVLFPVLILAGILLRSIQAGELASHSGWFYPLMTLHGLGMVGLWFTAAMAAAAHALSSHVEPSEAVAEG